MKKKIPTFKSDAEAERFIATSDLTQYDLTGGKAVQFESKMSQLNMRLPANLLDAVKRRAQLRGIPYTHFIREVLEQSLRDDDQGRMARRR